MGSVNEYYSHFYIPIGGEFVIQNFKTKGGA